MGVSAPPPLSRVGASGVIEHLDADILEAGGCQPTLPTKCSTLAAAPRTIPDVDADRESIARLA